MFVKRGRAVVIFKQFKEQNYDFTPVAEPYYNNINHQVRTEDRRCNYQARNSALEIRIDLQLSCVTADADSLNDGTMCLHWRQ